MIKKILFLICLPLTAFANLDTPAAIQATLRDRSFECQAHSKSGDLLDGISITFTFTGGDTIEIRKQIPTGTEWSVTARYRVVTEFPRTPNDPGIELIEGTMHVTPHTAYARALDFFENYPTAGMNPERTDVISISGEGRYFLGEYNYIGREKLR